MDLEETKKIIRNKIEADEAAREVRSHIKTYIHEKQNVREGFTETFKPLIETSESVKKSIDTQQNKFIEQLQKNQLALTAGFEGNRKAITSDFDKMDEVKKWDLSQLPGYEAIEEPEDDKPIFISTSDDLYKITHRNFNKIIGKEIYPDDNEEETMPYRDIVNIYKNSSIDKSRYKLMYDPDSEKMKLFDNKSKITTVEYKKDEMDKYLNNKESIDLLNFYGLKLPSEYKGKSLEELQKAFEKGMEETTNLKKSIKNVAEYKRKLLLQV